MGKRMIGAQANGESWLDESEERRGLEVMAGLSELFTMVVAGLGGQTPHMIAATVQALGCLLYEFHGAL
jgi:ribosomal RNA-processing protein 12